MMDTTYRLVTEAVSHLHQQGFGRPAVALILGSGLGALADRFDKPRFVEYKSIPGFPETTVSGHSGRLVWGQLRGTPVVAMQGRFHYYEDYSQRQLAFPVWVLRALGAEVLLVTNAAGGINSNFSVGDLMVLTDHLNLSGGNPLIGPNPSRFGPRFPDLSQAYNPALRQIAHEAAAALNIKLREGVYVSVSGPCFETPGEIAAYKRLGADAVGMSTVPEVIVAVHSGMQVLGISCITNAAAGLGAEQLSHQEVIDVTTKVQGQFQALLAEIVALVGRRFK